MHNRRLFIVPLALGSLLLIAMLAGVASAAPGDHGKGKGQDHASVVAFWTPDRIASAQPREVSPQGRPEAVEPQKPGNSGGGGKPGGGGSTTSSTGASWAGGGAVKERVGKVLFVMDGVAYVCSGTVVRDTRENESMVLTAGHCVFDETTGEFATNWIFVPDYEEALSFGCDSSAPCWSAAALVTSEGWANGGGSLAGFNEDYGFAIVGANSVGLLLEDRAGANPISFSGTRPSTVYAFGYPHASPYDGNDLVYCSGSTVADGWGGTDDSGVRCDMTGGSSGGGWFAPFDPATGEGTLVSVNSFKYQFGPYSKYMYGPLFDDDTAATYAAANEAMLDDGVDNNVVH